MVDKEEEQEGRSGKSDLACWAVRIAALRRMSLVLMVCSSEAMTFDRCRYCLKCEVQGRLS